MDVETQINCLKLVKKYHNTNSCRWKNKYRNDLFCMMKDFMLVWVKSVLGKWGMHRDAHEMLSLSWDAFLFALDHYDKGKTTPVPLFFYKYARYFLLIHFAKQQSVTVSLEELAETLELVHTDENMMFGKVLRLYQFRECLPEEHKTIWDDAYMSLSEHIMDKKGRNAKLTPGINQASYYNLKRSFVSIIKFVIKN